MFSAIVQPACDRQIVSSSRPWPSGVRTITMSTSTLSSPLTRFTHGPRNGGLPSTAMPRVVEKAIAAGRSSTTLTDPFS